VTAQDWADMEDVAYIAVPAGAALAPGVVCPVRYCVRAGEAHLWEIAAGRIVYPRGGERYDPADVKLSRMGLVLDPEESGT
jgi:hypothetical protein